VSRARPTAVMLAFFLAKEGVKESVMKSHGEKNNAVTSNQRVSI